MAAANDGGGLACLHVLEAAGGDAYVITIEGSGRGAFSGRREGLWRPSRWMARRWARSWSRSMGGSAAIPVGGRRRDRARVSGSASQFH